VSASIRQAEALVLRNLRYGDTSRIATLFTLELGKIGAIGKGARDPRSPFGASLEILSHSSFVLYYRPGRDLQFLKSGFLEREFRGLQRDSRRYLFAAAWVEFLDRIVLEGEPSPSLYRLALRGCEVLESHAVAALPELFRALELRAAALLGYAPQCGECLHCGRPAPDSAAPAGAVAPVDSEAIAEAPPLLDRWFFLPAEGGALCPACAGASEIASGVPLSARGLRRIRAMVLGSGRENDGSARPTEEIRERPPETTPSPGWLRTLDRITEEFLRYHIGTYRGLRSLEGLAGWSRPRSFPLASPGGSDTLR
jgi:DNA repair protein RecO